MLSTLGRISIRRSCFIFRVSTRFSDQPAIRVSYSYQTPVRFFATDLIDGKHENKAVLSKEIDNTPQGAVFTNPDIVSDWIYRVEKDTGRKYYINIKTNEILFNRTPDSKLAPVWRRIVAGTIDMSLAIGGGMLVYLLGAWEMGDISLGGAIGRIYAMLFFCTKDCALDHGTRSVGKKLMKLEVVDKHGELSGPYRNFFRNTIEMFTALTPFLSFELFMSNSMLVVIDSLMFVLFKKRIFDFALGSRVIMETDDHVSRVKLYKDKKSYKRQSETLEEVGMSALTQVMEQQKKKDEQILILEDMREKDKLGLEATNENSMEQKK